jgi:hypothetical protein
MGDKQWKKLERKVGELVGGKRYPANQGGLVDVESPNHVVQVKERKSLSLSEINRLVEEIEAIGRERGKVGLLAVKYRKGTGHPTDILIIQSATQWRRLTSETFDLFNPPDVTGVQPSG